MIRKNLARPAGIALSTGRVAHRGAGTVEGRRRTVRVRGESGAAQRASRHLRARSRSGGKKANISHRQYWRPKQEGND